MVHSAIVGVAAALFLLIRVSNPDTPLAVGPSGIVGWFIFGFQLATWLVLALQRSTYYHSLLTRKDPIGRSSSPIARLLEVSVTGTFGLLLWATMFATWLFFAPLMLLHWWLLQRRAKMTLYRYGLRAAPEANSGPDSPRWADGTPIDVRETARLGVLWGSGAALPVLAAGWIITAASSAVSPAAQSFGTCAVTALMVLLVASRYGRLVAAGRAN